ncbi:hypothetical protein AQUCO_04200134v1 [Aquilegia coerulea]|uniref:MADS-box domain-containing protein n=1 Tax=Aquilegia coerulea TaxID=218851 RepID=A0A2G5CPJ5_AQUCA|nr:hypothetical protein AQUCO_04200134v1 [Aquilegia coerulea]
MLKPRNVSFKTRKEGLKKKIRELTTLCDAQACMLIFHPKQTETIHHHHYPEPEIWPEKLEDFNKVITRYKNTTGSSSSNNNNNNNNSNQEEDTSVAAVIKKMQNNNNYFNLEACSKQQLEGILQKIDFNIEIVNQLLNPPPPPLDQVPLLLYSSDYDYDYDFGNCYFSDSAGDYTTMGAGATDSLVNFMC